MKLDIKKTNDPVLRAKTEEVTDFGMETQNLIDDMIETMRSANGIGLAAPQVGKSSKIIVCEYNTEDKENKLKPFPLTVVCNPEIVKTSKKEVNMVEGCLSFPGMEIIVRRPKEIKVKGLDRFGKNITLIADSLFGRVLQHETDHLSSTLLIDHIREINIIFIGTGTLGAPALEMLATDPQYKIKLVITGDIKSVSRNQSENPIAKIAQKYQLPLIRTKNINSSDIVEKIRKAKPKLGVMADFGQIIGNEIIALPRYGIINIHPSLLPKHRGPSPIQQTLLDGDKKSGVSLILTGEKMDAGPIISQAWFELRGTENTTLLKQFLANAGASLLLNSIPYYITKDLKPDNQDETQATYSRLFNKDDGLADFKTKAEIVDRKIRAFSDWPKTYIIVKGKKVQLISGHFEKDGTYLLDRVKPESKKEMSYDEYKRGYRTELTFQS
jgi:methionyl-tRNA formyltransferase